MSCSDYCSQKNASLIRTIDACDLFVYCRLLFELWYAVRDILDDVVVGNTEWVSLQDFVQRYFVRIDA